MDLDQSTWVTKIYNLRGYNYLRLRLVGLSDEEFDQVYSLVGLRIWNLITITLTQIYSNQIEPNEKLYDSLVERIGTWALEAYSSVRGLQYDSSKNEISKQQILDIQYNINVSKLESYLCISFTLDWLFILYPITTISEESRIQLYDLVTSTLKNVNEVYHSLDPEDLIPGVETFMFQGFDIAPNLIGIIAGDDYLRFKIRVPKLYATYPVKMNPLFWDIDLSPNQQDFHKQYIDTTRKILEQKLSPEEFTLASDELDKYHESINWEVLPIYEKIDSKAFTNIITHLKDRGNVANLIQFIMKRIRSSDTDNLYSRIQKMIPSIQNPRHFPILMSSLESGEDWSKSMNKMDSILSGANLEAKIAKKINEIVLGDGDKPRIDKIESILCGSEFAKLNFYSKNQIYQDIMMVKTGGLTIKEHLMHIMVSMYSIRKPYLQFKNYIDLHPLEGTKISAISAMNDKLKLMLRTSDLLFVGERILLMFNGDYKIEYLLKNIIPYISEYRSDTQKLYRKCIKSLQLGDYSTGYKFMQLKFLDIDAIALKIKELPFNDEFYQVSRVLNRWALHQIYAISYIYPGDLFNHVKKILKFDSNNVKSFNKIYFSLWMSCVNNINSIYTRKLKKLATVHHGNRPKPEVVILDVCNKFYNSEFKRNMTRLEVQVLLEDFFSDSNLKVALLWDNINEIEFSKYVAMDPSYVPHLRGIIKSSIKENAVDTIKELLKNGFNPKSLVGAIDSLRGNIFSAFEDQYRGVIFSIQQSLVRGNNEPIKYPEIELIAKYWINDNLMSYYSMYRCKLDYFELTLARGGYNPETQITRWEPIEYETLVQTAVYMGVEKLDISGSKKLFYQYIKKIEDYIKENFTGEFRDVELAAWEEKCKMAKDSIPHLGSYSPVSMLLNTKPFYEETSPLDKINSTDERQQRWLSALKSKSETQTLCLKSMLYSKGDPSIENLILMNQIFNGKVIPFIGPLSEEDFYNHETKTCPDLNVDDYLDRILSENLTETDVVEDVEIVEVSDEDDAWNKYIKDLDFSLDDLMPMFDSFTQKDDIGAFLESYLSQRRNTIVWDFKHSSPREFLEKRYDVDEEKLKIQVLESLNKLNEINRSKDVDIEKQKIYLEDYKTKVLDELESLESRFEFEIIKLGAFSSYDESLAKNYIKEIVATKKADFNEKYKVVLEEVSLGNFELFKQLKEVNFIPDVESVESNIKKEIKKRDNLMAEKIVALQNKTVELMNRCDEIPKMASQVLKGNPRVLPGSIKYLEGDLVEYANVLKMKIDEMYTLDLESIFSGSKAKLIPKYNITRIENTVLDASYKKYKRANTLEALDYFIWLKKKLLKDQESVYTTQVVDFINEKHPPFKNSEVEKRLINQTLKYAKDKVYSKIEEYRLNTIYYTGIGKYLDPELMIKDPWPEIDFEKLLSEIPESNDLIAKYILHVHAENSARIKKLLNLTIDKGDTEYTLNIMGKEIDTVIRELDIKNYKRYYEKILLEYERIESNIKDSIERNPEINSENVDRKYQLELSKFSKAMKQPPTTEDKNLLQQYSRLHKNSKSSKIKMEEFIKYNLPLPKNDVKIESQLDLETAIERKLQSYKPTKDLVNRYGSLENLKFVYRVLILNDPSKLDSVEKLLNANTNYKLEPSGNLLDTWISSKHTATFEKFESTIEAVSLVRTEWLRFPEVEHSICEYDNNVIPKIKIKLPEWRNLYEDNYLRKIKELEESASKELEEMFKPTQTLITRLDYQIPWGRPSNIPIMNSTSFEYKVGFIVQINGVPTISGKLNTLPTNSIVYIPPYIVNNKDIQSVNFTGYAYLRVKLDQWIYRFRLNEFYTRNKFNTVNKDLIQSQITTYSKKTPLLKLRNHFMSANKYLSTMDTLEPLLKRDISSALKMSHSIPILLKENVTLTDELYLMGSMFLGEKVFSIFIETCYSGIVSKPLQLYQFILSKLMDYKATGDLGKYSEATLLLVAGILGPLNTLYEIQNKISLQKQNEILYKSIWEIGAFSEMLGRGLGPVERMLNTLNVYNDFEGYLHWNPNLISHHMNAVERFNSEWKEYLENPSHQSIDSHRKNVMNKLLHLNLEAQSKILDSVTTSNLYKMVYTIRDPNYNSTGKWIYNTVQYLRILYSFSYITTLENIRTLNSNLSTPQTKTICEEMRIFYKDRFTYYSDLNKKLKPLYVYFKNLKSCELAPVCIDLIKQLTITLENVIVPPPILYDSPIDLGLVLIPWFGKNRVQVDTGDIDVSKCTEKSLDYEFKLNLTDIQKEYIDKCSRTLQSINAQLKSLLSPGELNKTLGFMNIVLEKYTEYTKKVWIDLEGSSGILGEVETYKVIYKDILNYKLNLNLQKVLYRVNLPLFKIDLPGLTPSPTKANVLKLEEDLNALESFTGEIVLKPPEYIPPEIVPSIEPRVVMNIDTDTLEDRLKKLREYSHEGLPPKELDISSWTEKIESTINLPPSNPLTDEQVLDWMSKAPEPVDLSLDERLVLLGGGTREIEPSGIHLTDEEVEGWLQTLPTITPSQSMAKAYLRSNPRFQTEKTLLLEDLILKSPLKPMDYKRKNILKRAREYLESKGILQPINGTSNDTFKLDSTFKDPQCKEPVVSEEYYPPVPIDQVDLAVGSHNRLGNLSTADIESIIKSNTGILLPIVPEDEVV